MTRLPIRLRLSLITSLLGLGIIVVVGLVGYTHTADELRDGVDQSLREELSEIVPVVVDPERSLKAHRVDADDGGLEVAQLLDADGVVVDATPGAEDLDLLRASGGRPGASTVALRGIDTPVRVMIAPVSVDGRSWTMTVGRSIDGVAATLADLRRRIAVLGLTAVVFLFTATYAVTSLSLRPVEKLRSEAATISPHHRGERLELPLAHDELRRLGDTLNAMIGRLEFAVDERRAFIASASHELRTPLTNLVAGLELGQRTGRSRAELERTIDDAAADAVRLADLTEGLLELTVTQGDPPTFAAVDLAAVADRAVSDVDPAGDRTVVVSIDDDLRVTGDEEQLRRVLANLVANAVIHGREPIEITAGRDEDEVAICVVDHGPGIPASMGRTAFLPFVRADEAHQRPGAGLGLAITSGIIDAHHGRIASGHDGGVHTVTIRLPGSPKSSPQKARRRDPIVTTPAGAGAGR